MPVVGVAKSGLGARAAQGARAGQPRATTAASTRRAFAAPLRAPALRRRRLPRPRDVRSSSRQELGDARRPLHYLAIPPSLFATVVEGLKQSGDRRSGGRVVVEKPFGRDLASAQRAQPRPCTPRLPRGRRSSASTTSSARSRSRTSPTSASPTASSSRSGTATTCAACRSRWPRTSASRGAARFYEEAGAIRDVVQNHLLQVLALLASDPPAGPGLAALRDGEGARAALRTPARARRRRARPVRRLPGRGRASRPTRTVETYAAVRLAIDSWRWADVPFFIRAGKCLPLTALEVYAELRRPPAAGLRRARSSAPTHSACASARTSSIALGGRGSSARARR